MGDRYNERLKYNNVEHLIVRDGLHSVTTVQAIDKVTNNFALLTYVLRFILATTKHPTVYYETA